MAQSTLEIMGESFNLVPIGESELVAATNLMKTIQNWNGSLEDAIVIITAKRYNCPVWTMNYRDFGVFKELEFWSI